MGYLGAKRNDPRSSSEPPGRKTSVRSALDAEHTQKRESEAQVWQRVLAAQEEERKRIARELHDQIGQYTAALRLGLESLQGTLAEQQLDCSAVMQLRGLIEQLDQEMDYLVLTLRPPALEAGLKAAILQYVLEWSERQRITVDFCGSEKDLPALPPDVETTIYRVTQEALNNIFKHAGAKRVSLILEVRRGVLQLVIEDDGCGFDYAQFCQERQARRCYGLAGMTERVALVQGSFELESEAGKGTTLFVRIPL
ncbi:MAG: sensor histidine kinase [Acidobacteria bacterium]|nr:sensor histidine kinase [Acidobacteriota bacterium]MBI3427679.1 sensor histidine kinase [Acidobacteriota bacterium]